MEENEEVRRGEQGGRGGVRRVEEKGRGRKEGKLERVRNRRQSRKKRRRRKRSVESRKKRRSLKTDTEAVSVSVSVPGSSIIWAIRWLIAFQGASPKPLDWKRSYPFAEAIQVEMLS